MADTRKEYELTPLERFHRGEPLNAELKTVKEGVEQAAAAHHVVTMPRPVITDAMRELTNAEKGDLRELRAHPGWRVLERLKEKTLQTHERSAIASSQIDPLGQSAEVVKLWGYQTMRRSAYQELEVAIEMAIKVDVQA